MRLIAVLLCGSICFYCAYFYDASANPGHRLESHLQLGTAAKLGGVFWSFKAFPIMGRKVWLDLLFILLAFPIVGALGGTLIGPGIGTVAGVYLAVSLPWFIPWPIGVIYIFGAIAAFCLPRLKLDNLPQRGSP